MNDGGAAFPRVVPLNIDRKYESGMSLRDYFAAKAMQGYLASCPAGIDWCDIEGLTLADWAKTSYRMADAMLAQRQVEGK